MVGMSSATTRRPLASISARRARQSVSVRRLSRSTCSTSSTSPGGSIPQQAAQLRPVELGAALVLDIAGRDG